MRDSAGLAVCRDLPDATLDRLERNARLIEFAHGATIFRQNDAADAVYGILVGTGHVRIGSISRNAKTMMVEVFQAGDLFGEIGVFDGGLRTADAVVEGRVRVLRISAPYFLQALHDTPDFGANVARSLAARLRRTYGLLQDATFERLEVRLARQIVYLARRSAALSDGTIRVPGRLRQGDLANLLGTTPRSIITVLNEWRASGLVRYDTERAQLTVLDPARLHDMMDQEQEF